jgi:ribonuclease P protein component
MESFQKHERLCSKILLDKLFFEGKTFLVYPLKFTYLELAFENPSPAQIVFIVPKKRFKKANERNLIKRKLREIYRESKEQFYNNLYNNEVKLVISISYIANNILEYNKIKENLNLGLQHINNLIINKLNQN